MDGDDGGHDAALSLTRLWRYRQNLIEAGQRHPSRLAAMLGLGYLSAWTLIGLAVLACAAAMLRMPALARAVPIAAGLVILTAGTLQFTAWKARHLACWGDLAAIGAARQHVHLRVALMDGLRLGLACSRGSGGLTAILLVAGMMNLPIMLAVAAAITLERLAPHGRLVACLIGAVAVVAALAQIGGALVVA